MYRVFNHLCRNQIQGLLVLGLLVVVLPFCSCSDTPEWIVGIGRAEITPKKPMWMGGFAARTQPSEGIAMPLYVKSLAIEDREGNRIVLIVGEILGYSESLASQVARRVEDEYGLTRDQLLFSATHTHSGPFIKRARAGAWELDPKEQELVDIYAQKLVDYTAEAVGSSLAAMQPAQLSFGRTTAPFAANRRVITEQGVGFGVNPEAPVDHSVPVLTARDLQGNLQAIAFGYACHNTTLGPDNYLYHGDFAGVAHSWLEAQHPGALSFFLTGCGADINPNPRRGMDTVQRHGEDLATAVEHLLKQEMEPVNGPHRSKLVKFPVSLMPPPTRKELEDRLKSESVYVRRHASEMLKVLDREGRLMTEYPYTVQVLQFGDDVTLVALAGEVVVDYSLRLTRELAPSNVWVASHCNDVFAYIPSRRILDEGGYEADSSMMFYGLPTRWDPSVEETIVAQVHDLVGSLRAR